MPPDVNSFSPFEDYSEYSPFGRDYGNPAINLLMQGIYGFDYTPRPESGQSIYDAFLQRERSAQFMNLQRSGFMNNQVFKAMGISDNAATGAMGRFMGSPDGLFGRMMSPIVGGNPMAAQMQLYAGLSGADVMGNFGRINSISAGEVEETMQALTSNFYRGQAYETGPDGEPGARDYVRQKTRTFIEDRLREGETGRKYLQDLGIDLDVDSEGRLTDEGRSQLEQLDITSPEGGEESDIARNIKDRIRRKRQVAAMIDVDVDKLIDETDETLKKEYNEHLENQLKKYNIATEEELKKLRDEGSGELDTAKVRELLSKTAELDPIEKLAMESEAYREGKTRFTGFNFEKSRGFKLEDFTSAFNKAAELRLLGDKKGQSPAEVMRQFSENAGGALDAARSLFGKELSGGELIERISEFVGNSAYDLTTQSQIRSRVGGPAAATAAGMPSGMPPGMQPGVQPIPAGMPSGVQPIPAGETASTAEQSAQGAVGDVESRLKTADSGRDAQSVEDILRKAKATARVAGISLQTMFGIIESAKELARNNPQLQYLNASTTTEMSVKAIKTAAQMGSVMSAEDYRKAGGSQGITAANITAEQEFMQSGFASGFSALMAFAKGKDENVYNELKAKLEKGFSPEDFTSEFITDTASKLGVDPGLMVGAIMSNPELQQRGFADEDISKTLSASAKPSTIKAFYNALENVGIGEEEIKAKMAQARKEGKSFSDVYNSEILPNIPLDEASQNVAKFGRTFMMQEYYESTMTEEQKGRVQKVIDDQAALEADMSKRLGGINAPVVTQMVDAIASGEDIQGVAQAMEGIFSTEGIINNKIKEARVAARLGGEQIAAASAMEGGDVTISESMAEGINTVIENRKTELEESGNTELADKLGEVSKEELENASVQLKSLRSGGVKEAKNTLADLRKKEEEGSLTELDESMLEALQTAEKLGVLESEEAFDMAAKGGVRNLGAATIEARRQEVIASEVETVKAATLKTADERLDIAEETTAGPGGELIKKAREAYLKDDGTVDMEKMLTDFKAGGDAGFFTEEMRKNFAEGGQAEQLGMVLTTTQDKLNEIDQKAAVEGGKSPEDKGRDDVKDMLKQFKEIFQGGGGIADALKQLTTALTS